MKRPPAILLVIVVVLGVLCGANAMLVFRHLRQALASPLVGEAQAALLFQRALLFLVTAVALVLIALRKGAARFAVTVALCWIALAPAIPAALTLMGLRPFTAGAPLHVAGRALALLAFVTLALWIAWVFRSSEAVKRYFEGS